MNHHDLCLRDSPDPDCMWCARLRQAEQRGMVRAAPDRAYDIGYEQGQRDALAGAVQRVEALTTRGEATNVVYNAAIYHAIAAINGTET
jgi:hypothetical protein